MENPHPMDELLNKINELLQFAQQNSSKQLTKNDLTPEIEKKLELVEKEVAKFKAMSETFVEKSDLTPEEVQKRLAGESKVELSPAAKHLINRAEELAFKAQTMGALGPAGVRSAPRGKKTKESESGKKRRQKFKRFGSDEKWKPL